jgi:hypothetical protein
VPLSGCGRLLGIGNYNFLCPYSHDLTHGLALSLGALACLLLPRKLTIANTAASGALVGLVFLTKLETLLACSAAITVGFILRVAIRDRRTQLQLTAVLMISALAPGILAFLILNHWMPWKTSFIGVSSAIYWPLHSEVSSLPFYRNLLGTDDFKHNLLQMLVGVALIAAAGVVTAGASFLSRRIARVLNPQVAPMAFFCGGATVFAVSMWKSEHWFFSVPKALPIAVVWLLWIWIIRYRHERRGTDESAVLILRLAFSIFALVFLIKIFFNAALFHYGFALAMPATLLMISLIVCWIPQYASTRGADLRVGTAVGMSFVFVMLFNYLFAMSLVLANEQYRIGSGANSFVADDRAFAVQAALQLIETTMPRKATLAVVPEGAIINVLSGRMNPTPHNVLMPVELRILGERRVAEDFQDHPPDFVLLCHKDTTEYGAPLFGRDYGRDLDAWLRQNYVEVGLIGNRPFQNPERFGMLLMRHR